MISTFNNLHKFLANVNKTVDLILLWFIFNINKTRKLKDCVNKALKSVLLKIEFWGSRDVWNCCQVMPVRDVLFQRQSYLKNFVKSHLLTRRWLTCCTFYIVITYSTEDSNILKSLSLLNFMSLNSTELKFFHFNPLNSFSLENLELWSLNQWSSNFFSSWSIKRF